MPSMRSLIPTSIDEAKQIIADVASSHTSVAICGASTKQMPAPNSDRMSTRSLNRVVEFSPADLTITVEAGITLRQFDEILRPHRLRLPLDPPDYDGRATLGGVLASNDSGPLRLAHGTAREHVIGMSMVLADGSLIKAGGKVVKNVAGYDLHRLFVGSYGSLGMI